eukprot:SAG11_NODE_10617_length_816_cov_2.655509_3_plen_72_part_01
MNQKHNRTFDHEGLETTGLGTEGPQKGLRVAVSLTMRPLSDRVRVKLEARKVELCRPCQPTVAGRGSKSRIN